MLTLFRSIFLQACDNISYSFPWCPNLAVWYLIALHKPEQQAVSNVVRQSLKWGTHANKYLAGSHLSCFLRIFCTAFEAVICKIKFVYLQKQPNLHMLGYPIEHKWGQVNFASLKMCFIIDHWWTLLLTAQSSHLMQWLRCSVEVTMFMTLLQCNLSW